MKLFRTVPASALQLLATGFLLANGAHADVVVVNQVGFTFSPQNITINLGDTVRWIRNAGDHTVTEGTDGMLNGTEAFHSLLDGTTPVVEFVFDATFLAANPMPGDLYNYVCIPHFSLGMIGSILVNTEPGTSFCDCSGGTSPCNNNGPAGAGCTNSTGTGATLSASGTNNAATDNLAFQGTGLSPNKPCLLFFGTAQANGGLGIPFGDGLRCAGGQIQRLSVTFSSAAGDASWGPGLNAGFWNPGDTRHFQIWYRDPSGGPCASGFNVSNGYSVSFN